MLCSRTVSKVFLVCFNLFLALSGGLVLGIVLFRMLGYSRINDIVSLIPSESAFSLAPQSSTYSLGAGGAFFVVVGLWGCGVALREDRCMLLFYSTILSVILLVETATATAIIYFKDNVEDYLKAFLVGMIKDRYDGASIGSNGQLSASPDALTAAWDQLQASQNCCGVTNYTDYENGTQWRRNVTLTVDGSNMAFTALVPVVCCKMVDTMKASINVSAVQFVDLHQCLSTANSNSTHTEPCYDHFIDVLSRYSVLCTGFTFGGAWIAVFGVLAACLLVWKK